MDVYEFATCSVCDDVYDGIVRCPRILVCGHTFCSSCIKQLLETMPSCPICRKIIEADNLEAISINFSLKQLAERYNTEKLLPGVASDVKAFIISKDGEITRWGKLDVYEGDLRAHCVQEEPPPPSSLCLGMDKYLTIMTGKTEWPRKIFFQLTADDILLGDVIVCLNDTAREISETVLHIAMFGNNGLSFKTMGMGFYGLGPYLFSFHPLCVPDCCVSEKLKQDGKNSYKGWMKGDFAISTYEKDDELKLFFLFWAAGSDEELEAIPTAKVVKGIEVLEEAFRRSKRLREYIRIVDCGWIIN